MYCSYLLRYLVLVSNPRLVSDLSLFQNVITKLVYAIQVPAFAKHKMSYTYMTKHQYIIFCPELRIPASGTKVLNSSFIISSPQTKWIKFHLGKCTKQFYRYRIKKGLQNILQPHPKLLHDSSKLSSASHSAITDIFIIVIKVSKPLIVNNNVRYVMTVSISKCLVHHNTILGKIVQSFYSVSDFAFVAKSFNEYFTKLASDMGFNYPIGGNYTSSGLTDE